MASARHPSNYLPSVVGNDVRDRISVAPADYTGIHISDLEEVVHGGITGSTAVSTNLSKSFRRTDNRAWRSLSCLELRPGRSDALTLVSCKPRGQSTYPQNYEPVLAAFAGLGSPIHRDDRTPVNRFGLQGFLGTVLWASPRTHATKY